MPQSAALQTDLREACRLFQRGGVTKRELNAMCMRLGVSPRFWQAVYGEWNGSDRMRRRDSQFWNGTRWVSVCDQADAYDALCTQYPHVDPKAAK